LQSRYQQNIVIPDEQHQPIYTESQ